MKTYMLLLRGINVSGQKKIKMTGLKQSLEKLGLQNVQTYIQSGNVVFDSAITSESSLEKSIEKLIFESYKFEVPVLVFEAKEFETIVKGSPYLDSETVEVNHSYFVLLKTLPADFLVALLNSETFLNEEFVISAKCIYLNCKIGYGKAKCTNNFFERKLKVQATTRNLKTMSKLVALSSVVN
ncbi:DUF1697 domain-containing protein [Cellulophaga sp. Z1A5H]|uniref:DUF1697 domain-containing protein n=1 Tax=Cellulophaga sp. Z1A5H TaxID=2687291 RepID=UPI0013FD2EFF|nr:DUF1697 domain-containing protein [Cellulophaga sp. Z1A5H]